MKQSVRQLLQVDIKSIVKNTKVNSQTSDGVLTPKRQKQVSKENSRKTKGSDKFQTTIKSLYDRYNKHYPEPKRSDLALVNFFFNKAKVQFEWSAPTFNDIPGEKVRRAMEKRQKAAQILLEEEKSYISSKSLASDPNLSMLESEFTHLEHKDQNKLYHGKTEGIPFELINQLPEIAFLGRCNSGKSTLLNNITTEVTRNHLNEYANASKKAGFTKTINCFNVGKRFRIIDTPGYGTKGTAEQGRLTMDYLQKRRELRRSFLLISANQGFSEYDATMVDLLVSNGIPFEIVLTKMDTVKDMTQVERIIEESNVLNLPTSPRFIFLNSMTNKHCQKRFGIDILRYVILDACGLSPGVKPSKIKKN